MTEEDFLTRKAIEDAKKDGLFTDEDLNELPGEFIIANNDKLRFFDRTYYLSSEVYGIAKVLDSFADDALAKDKFGPMSFDVKWLKGRTSKLCEVATAIANLVCDEKKKEEGDADAMLHLATQLCEIIQENDGRYKKLVDWVVENRLCPNVKTREEVTNDLIREAFRRMHAKEDVKMNTVTSVTQTEEIVMAGGHIHHIPKGSYIRVIASDIENLKRLTDEVVECVGKDD